MREENLDCGSNVILMYVTLHNKHDGIQPKWKRVGGKGDDRMTKRGGKTGPHGQLGCNDLESRTDICCKSEVK